MSQAALVPMELLAKRLATVTVGISDATASTLGNVDVIIPCGVDRELFVPGLKSIQPSILFVGTVGGRKRGHLLLQHFQDVVRRHVPNGELWMVSPDRCGDANEGVKWFGKISDERLASLFREAWVFCLPSTYEGFGVPYIEALASGTVVIATPNAGANEILRNSTAGDVVEDEMLGPTIVRILTDHAARGKMEACARRESERYSWDIIATAYEGVYETAVRRRPRLREKRNPSNVLFTD